MAEQYYALYLKDLAVRLSSNYKLFVGTKSDILDAAERMKGIDKYQDTVAAIDAWFRGDTGAIPAVGYEKAPMLSPVELVSASSQEMGETQLVYMQYSGIPHFMRFDSAMVEQIIISDGMESIRMIRATMKNLGLANAASEFHRLQGGFKGHDRLLDVQTQPDGSVTLQNRLFVQQETEFHLPEELEANMQDPGTLIFDEIFGEIFGAE